ncbi:3-deoxy-7-phosphoheptulonate synthase [Streptomyces sp. NPDC102467]|uniref:3-deoxy-7-phosphoheptulonate synthase n=1 Tax=Streptomyces sp. NPDC102467 TaxID=3366179 RepID=UPI00382D303C
MTINAIPAHPAGLGEGLSETELRRIRGRTALQQPVWDAPELLDKARNELGQRPPLVYPNDVRTLSRLLAEVAAGSLQVIQAGDCAEDFEECSAEHILRKAALLDAVSGIMSLSSTRPVIQVGRLAGQFGKPRSKPTEIVDGVELPVYRGHLVNRPEPTRQARRADPLRLLLGYDAAFMAMDALRTRAATPVDAPVWTSHEALVLDYELPLVRRDDRGELLLTSTHWPWIGERTRQVDGAHVELLASVANPVACKVGPGMRHAELLALCAKLDPRRTPGRLTLIARMGADNVSDVLPGLVRAVREAGHPVIWLTDPMHGNTVTAPGGLKTRLVTTVLREVELFQKAVLEGGGAAGGLHLETTPHDVTECVDDVAQMGQCGEKYISFCDPRLNSGQALEVAASWRI